MFIVPTIITVVTFTIHVSLVITLIMLGHDPITVIGLSTSAKYMLEFCVCYFLCRSDLPTPAQNTIFLHPLDGAFSNWMTYIKIALPAGLILLSEQVVFEVMIVVSGWMGELSLQAMAVIMSVLSFTYDIGFGFSFAVASLVGQYVGLDQSKVAK